MMNEDGNRVQEFDVYMDGKPFEMPDGSPVRATIEFNSGEKEYGCEDERYMLKRLNGILHAVNDYANDLSGRGMEEYALVVKDTAKTLRGVRRKLYDDLVDWDRIADGDA